MKRLFGIIVMSVIVLISQSVYAQLVVNTTQTPQQLVEDILLGQGVTASNITFSGTAVQRGYFNGASSNIGLPEGVILSSGNVNTAVGPNNQGGAGSNVGSAGDDDLALLSDVASFDAAVLEFDFVPTGDSIDFSYVFGSEEYNEYVCGSVNDVFGFFLSGPGFAGPYSNGAVNIALIPGTNTPVSINTVNLGVAGVNGTASTCAALDPNWASYNVYFTNNPNGTSVQYDGFTTVLRAKAAVQCGQTYHIKLAISDGGDGVFDSGVFLEARSFRSDVVEVNISTASGNIAEGGGWIVEGCTEATIQFNRPASSADTTLAVPVYVSGTVTNSDFFGLADTVFFAIGDTSISLSIFAIQDGIDEPNDSLIITVYTISLCGDTIVSTGVIHVLDFGPEYPVTVNPDFQWCSTDPVPLSALATGGNPGYTYNWSNGDVGEDIFMNINSDTTLTVQATDACGTLSNEATVNIDYVSMALLTSSDVTLTCPGDNATLTAIASGGVPGYSYVWSNGAVTSTINVQPTQTTDYIVTATDNCPQGASIQDTITVTVFPYVPLEVLLNDSVVTCPGDQITIESTIAHGAQPFQFSWNTGSTTFATTANPQTTTDLILTVTDACGTVDVDTSTIEVPVYSALTLNLLNDDLLTSDTITICEFWADTVNSSVTGGLAPYIYSWNGTLIGGAYLNTDSAIMNVNYELPPDSSVTEIYSLSVTDQCNETVIVEVPVSVISCDVIQPNVFNPNSTYAGGTDYCGNVPQNNVFNLPCLELYPGNKMLIFDRWGKKCYETENYHMNPWNGGNQSTGTFFYVCELPNGKEAIKGYFQLIR